MSRSRNFISSTCECEWWTHEREQMSPNEYFQEYLANINEILFDTWDRIFGDVEEYSTTCHGWIIFLDDKMDDKSNELTFINDGCQTHENHGWPTISFIKYGIIWCWFYLEKYNTWNVDAILQGYTSYFFNMNFSNI